MLTTPTPAKRSSSSANTVPSVGASPSVARRRLPRRASRTAVDGCRDRGRVGGGGRRRARRDPSPRRRGQHAGHAAQVEPGRAGHGHPGVEVVDPVDRHLVDAQAEALRGDQDLGVEEPGLVVDQGKDDVGRLAPERLEPALGVAARTGQCGPEQQVVGPGDHLPPGPADDVGAGGQAGADGHVAVARSAAGRPGAAGRRARWPGRRPCRRPPATGWPSRRPAAPDPVPCGRGGGPGPRAGWRPVRRRSSRCRRCWRCRPR